MNKTFYKIFSALYIAFPVVVMAAGEHDLKWLITEKIGGYLTSIVPIIFAIAVVIFLWAGIRFMRADEKDREELRQFFLWGIIALAVMASIWGLVAFVTNSFGLDSSTKPTIPKF